MKNLFLVFTLLLSLESHAVYKSLFTNIEKDLEARSNKGAIEENDEATMLYNHAKKLAYGCVTRVSIVGEDERNESDWDSAGKGHFWELECDNVDLHNKATVLSVRYEGARIYFVPLVLEGDYCDSSQLHGVAIYRATYKKGAGSRNTPVRVGIIPGDSLTNCYREAHVTEIMELGLKYKTQFKY